MNYGHSLMLKIPSNRSDTMVEFRRDPMETFKPVEVPSSLQDSSIPWRYLTRLETLF
jgi:hypothetical protein